MDVINGFSRRIKRYQFSICTYFDGFLYFFSNFSSLERRMHCYMVTIAHEYRGLHIGSCFYRKLEEIAREKGIDEIEALCRKVNDVAVNYHLHNGLQIEAYKVVKKI